MLTFNTIKFKVKLTCLLMNQIKILGARRKYVKDVHHAVRKKRKSRKS